MRDERRAAVAVGGVSIHWFRRFAEIPGVAYEAPGFDRRRLKGHNAVPEVHTIDRDQDVPGPRQTLWWGSGSASPAHDRAFVDWNAMPTAKVLRKVAEALEVPGQPTDYHFAIQGAATALWSRRRAEPEVLDEVERLCWLDIRLIQARPDAISDEYRPEGGFHSVTAFKTLITLYEREGALREALEVATLAERFDQLGEKAEELRERLAVLEAEDA